jgi:glutamate formiminotransferase
MENIKVQVSLEWEFTKKEYEEAKEFIKEQKWAWDTDPMTAVLFLNQIGWPTMIGKKVNV